MSPSGRVLRSAVLTSVTLACLGVPALVAQAALPAAVSPTLSVLAAANDAPSTDDGALARKSPTSRAKPTVYLPLNDEGWSYVAPPYEGHCLQTYRLYLPRSEPPEGGWPVIVQAQLSGYHHSPEIKRIPQGTFLGSFLDAGVAVVTARITPSVVMSDPAWDTWCGADKPDIPGHGLFHAPGVVPPDLAAEGIAPYDTFEYHMPEKDAVLLLQHVRFMAKQTTDLQTLQQRSMAKLDHRFVGVHGGSAGAMSLMWPTLGPDRRDELPFVGLPGQYAESSRADLAIFEEGAVWWPLFHPEFRPFVPHFGLWGHSEIPAPTLGQTSAEELLQASALFFEDVELNSAMPMYFIYDEASIAQSYERQPGACSPQPFCFEDQGLEGMSRSPVTGLPNRHPAWSGYAWKTQHPHTQLAIGERSAYLQRKGVEALPFFGKPKSNWAMHQDAVRWALERFDERRQAFTDIDHRWHDLGHGLAGSRGVPTLTGAGSLVSGESANLTLSGALEHAKVVLVAGHAPAMRDLQGGVLVPRSDAVVVDLDPTDERGTLHVPSIWPSDGPASGSTYYVQLLVRDPGAPKGFAFSNALELRVP